MQKIRIALLILFLTVLGFGLLHLATDAVDHFSKAPNHAFTTQQHQIPR